MRQARLRQLAAAIASALVVWLGGDLTARVVTAAMPDAERSWVVGARAFEDGLYDVASRELGRFTELSPADGRRGDAAFLRGKSAYALGRYPEALAEFQTAERYTLEAATPGEAIFWQAE